MEALMTRRYLCWVCGSALCLLAAGLVFSMSAVSQDQEAVQKVYADVSGTYEFVYEGQSMTIVFLVSDGRLYGREESGGEDTECKPLDLNALKFEATVQDSGQYYEILFFRDENGKVNKCRLATGGVEIDGTRVK
jgi:hypothetical protein